jgi:hypothetical protein
MEERTEEGKYSNLILSLKVLFSNRTGVAGMVIFLGKLWMHL